MLCTLLGAGLAPALARAAGTQVVIAPTRLVFEGGQRSGMVHLSNRGATPSSVRISVVNKRMLESGLIVDIDQPQPDERFVDRLIRYSPRRVMLPPGGSQTVRLLMRVPQSGLAPGEYRSHLVLSSVPMPAAPVESDDEESIGVAALMIVEMSIPVIYRAGRLDASVRFSSTDVRLETPAGGLATLHLRLEREGERSVYGDVEVDYARPDGSVYQIAQMTGIAVYYPTPARALRIGLRPPDGLRLDSGELRVSFRERDRHDPAHAEIAIPLR